MLETIIVILVVIFIILPIAGSGLCGDLPTYKECFCAGNGIAIGLSVFALIGSVIMVSIGYVFFDGISLYDAALKIYNEFN